MAELLSDFLHGSPDSDNFFRASFLKPSDRVSTVALAARRPLHPVIRQLLTLQNPNPESAANLEKLSRVGVSVVVTGQQLGVCGGPLFTLYKILSAVRFSMLLEHETGSPVVPIFWLQSEDHDFEEIRSTTFVARNRQLIELALPKRPNAFHDSCGNIVLSPEDEHIIQTAIRSLGFPDTERLAALLQAYSSGKTLSQAFASWVQYVCKRWGVLTIDPNCRQVKQLTKELIASTILRTAGIYRVLSDRAQWLESKSYTVQVPAKAGSPLFFLSLRDASSQRRVRLQSAEEDRWGYPGGELTGDDLFRLLDSQPELFTSSALIRPILQDSILPTAAYVCGPVEFNYWVQLKPLYEFFGLTQPLVVPRAQLMVWEPQEALQLKNHGLNLPALSGDIQEALRAKYRGTSSDPDKLFSSLEHAVSEALESLRPAAEALDPGSLISALGLTKSSINHNLEKFKGKWVRSLGFREPGLSQAFSQLQQYAFPKKIPQERAINLSYFYLMYGQLFLDAVFQSIYPGDFRTHSTSSDINPLQPMDMKEVLLKD